MLSLKTNNLFLETLSVNGTRKAKLCCVNQDCSLDWTAAALFAWFTFHYSFDLLLGSTGTNIPLHEPQQNEWWRVIAVITASRPWFHLNCAPEVSFSESSDLRLSTSLLIFSHKVVEIMYSPTSHGNKRLFPSMNVTQFLKELSSGVV